MGNTSPINRLRTDAEYQSEGGRRAAGSIRAYFRRVDHTLYKIHFPGRFVEDGAARSDRVPWALGPKGFWVVKQAPRASQAVQAPRASQA